MSILRRIALAAGMMVSGPAMAENGILTVAIRSNEAPALTTIAVQGQTMELCLAHANAAARIPSTEASVICHGANATVAIRLCRGAAYVRRSREDRDTGTNALGARPPTCDTP